MKLKNLMIATLAMGLSLSTFAAPAPISPAQYEMDLIQLPKKVEIIENDFSAGLSSDDQNLWKQYAVAITNFGTDWKQNLPDGSSIPQIEALKKQFVKKLAPINTELQSLNFSPEQAKKYTKKLALMVASELISPSKNNNLFLDKNSFVTLKSSSEAFKPVSQ